MINLLKSSQVAVNVRFDYRGTPDQNDGIAAQEVAVLCISDVIEVLCRHTILLTRLFEALLFENPADQAIFKVHELQLKACSGQCSSAEPIGNT